MIPIPVVVVDLLQLCDVPHQYTVNLPQLVLDVSLWKELANFQVELFSNRTSRNNVRVVYVSCKDRGTANFTSI